MNKPEVIKLLAAIQSLYRNFTVQDKEATVNTWQLILSDLDAQAVQAALVAYARTDRSGFAPTPGQLIGKMQQLTQPEELGEMEAWSLVARAIRRGTYSSAEMYAELPETVQKAVGTADQIRNWAMDENYNEEVARSAFLRAYRVEATRKKELQALPEQMQQLIASINERSDRRMLENARKHMQPALPEPETEKIPTQPDRVTARVEEEIRRRRQA